MGGEKVKGESYGKREREKKCIVKGKKEKNEKRRRCSREKVLRRGTGDRKRDTATEM